MRACATPQTASPVKNKIHNLGHKLLELNVVLFAFIFYLLLIGFDNQLLIFIQSIPLLIITRSFLFGLCTLIVICITIKPTQHTKKNLHNNHLSINNSSFNKRTVRFACLMICELIVFVQIHRYKFYLGLRSLFHLIVARCMLLHLAKQIPSVNELLHARCAASDTAKNNIGF